MDDAEARELLRAERARVQRLLDATVATGQDERSEADEQGVDIADPAESLVAEQVDDAVAAALTERLEAIRRAEARLDAGTFGRSIRSGLEIPDDRLRADPAAELTVEEARRGP
jgi:DnaK suppressor protein